MKNKFFAKACLFVIVFLVSIISCEIGLGSAVDTQPPSLVIDSPKVDAVIRDVFAISGRWSDDGTIESINVELKRTDGKSESIKIDGEFSKDELLKETGTWKILVDYQKEKIGDGTYQATVSITDKSRHVTTQSTTFTIDNTAPVLVLSRPSIKDGQSGFDSYGRTFTIEGKAADDNDVSLIEVKIFENKDSTEPMKTVELYNVPLTIEQDVAVYEAEQENDYSVIYGDTEEGKAAQRYCTISIFDEAQRYPEDGSDQTEEDKKGNCTNTYYMNSEMTSLLQGSFKITDLYHMMNGTYNTDPDRAATTENILEQLKNYEVTKSKFSINPANNPKFIVSSGNVLENGKDLDNIDYQLTSGNRYIEVEIAPGLDGYPINPDTVGVYLVECDKKGNQKEGAKKIWLINPGAEYHKMQDEAENQDLESGYGVYSVSGSTYKFKTTKLIHKNYYNVSVGKYYLIMVEGNDSQGADSGKIISDGKYGFKLVSNEEKIELSVKGVPDYLSTKPAAWNVEGHKKFTVTLSWTTTTEGPFDVYRLDKTGNEYEKLSEEPYLSENVWYATEEFNYNTLKQLAPEGKEFPEKLVYVLQKNNDVISTTARINLNYDSSEPNISNIQFTNSYVKEIVTQDENGNDITKYTYYVRNDGTNKSNITGIATDDTGIEKVVLKVQGLNNASTSDGRFKFNNVDFSSLSADGVTAKIIATDIAGNQTTESLNIVFDKIAPHGVHEIDASSKNLYLRIGNSDNDDIDPSDSLWDDAFDKGVGGKYGNGTFGNATTIQIRGKFDDGETGSGVAMIYYKVFDTEHLLSSDPETAASEMETIKEQVLNESTGKFAPLAIPETKRVFYNVGRKLNDSGVPVEPAKPDTNQIFEGSTCFNDELNTKGYYKYYKNVESNFNETITGFKEGNNYLVFVVQDNVGNTAIDTAVVNFEGVDTTFVNYTLNVDTTPPSDITTKSASGIIYTNRNNVPVLWGTVSDKSNTTNASAGIRSFVLTRDEVSTKIYAKLTPLNDENDPTLRKWEVSASDLTSLLPEVTDDSKTVSILATATDDAGVGNTTPAVVATITVDTKCPTVTIDSESPSDADSNTAGIQVNGLIKLTGTSDDANGIKELVGLYYRNHGSSDELKQVVAEKEGTINWKFKNINTQQLDGVNSIADGTVVDFYVAVKDNAGNIGYSEPKTVTINQDTDRPVIHLSTLALTYKDELGNTKKMDPANPVWLNTSNFSGTVNDDDGAVEYVKIITKPNTDNTPPSNEEWEAADNRYKNGIWSINFVDSAIRVYIQVKEKEGKVYTSNLSSTTYATYGPKIEDVNSEKFGYNDENSTADDVIYLKVDTKPPYLSNIFYYTSDTLYDNPQTAISDSDWIDAQLYIRTDKFGGAKHYLYLKYKAFDTNGIYSVTPSFENSVCKLTEEIVLPSGQENYKEFISCFDIKNVTSGLKKIIINIKDNAAASSGGEGITEDFDITVDNTEPEISFSNYTSGSSVYGSSAVTLRGTTSDTNKVVKVEYALLAGEMPQNFDGWIEITDENAPTHTSPLGWQIVFDDKTPQNNTTFTDPYSYHAELLKKALFTLYEVDENDQAQYDETKRIYIWIRATDELGNSGINKKEQGGEGFFLDVIPNGDRPAVEITYPSSNTSVGGSIRITGTTDIQDVAASVSEVYIQIDPSYDSVAGFNSDWATELQTLMTAKGVTSYSIVDDPTATVAGNTQSFADKIGKGIRSQGSSKLNWFLRINENKEFNSKVGGSNRKIAIRAYAISSTGKVSVSELCTCEIDPEAPIFGGTDPLRFVQYEDANLTIESASRNFENGVYLKGQWYLVGSIEDDSGIRQITLDDTNIVWTEGSGDSEVVKTDGTNRAVPNSIPSSISKFKNYTLRIPVGNTTADSFGKIDYEISATDGSDSQTGNELKFTIYYDNKAPGFELKTGNGKELEVNGKIYQSNGAYTVQGSFAEPSDGQNNQSGFERIAMFFTRVRTVSGAKGLYILDPMLDSGSNGNFNFIKIADINNVGEETYVENVEKKDGLFWRKTTGTLENTNELTIADTSLITNKTVRNGGICMVDNVMYRITRITGTKITLGGTLTDFSTAKPVYFAYAQIIDNLSQESGSTVVYTNNDVITNGDGDCMIEGVQFAGGEYNWNASLDSSNMLDGNVTMSFVAYDAAGNYTADSIAQKISNNAPRIAGVIFGTDTNLNGEVDDNELITSYETVFTGITNVRDGKVYNGQDENGELITSYEIPVSINVKGAVKVKPMIVGGNTTLGWQYTYINKSGVTQSTTTTKYNGVGHSYDGSVRTNNLKIDIYLKDFLEKQIKEGEQNLKFTIWDETDGSTLGDESTGSAKADIILPVNIIIADSVDPEAVVYPFFWKSKNENSVYQNNPKKGHIELESELPESFTTDGSGTLDRDPKVSGMITFDGVASDNVIVNTIKITIPGYNSGNEFIIAQRDASATDTDGWTSTNLYYKKGDEVKADASLTGDAAKPWVFELISDEYDDDGKNIITFRFHFNTENISSKALANASVKFTAVDKGSPALSNDVVGYSNARSSTPGDISTTTVSPTGCYKVDIVPYITRVKTVLSDLKKSNPSVYARSAKGNYAVSASEILNIEGFNIAGGSLKFEKTGSGTVTADYDSNAGGQGVGGYAIPSTAKSGNLVVTVGGIDSLNNSNNNNAKGSYAQTTTNNSGDKDIYDNYYNRQPNGDNNNILTDDVKLDIWQINPNAVIPISGVTSQPVMAINPTNHDVGFAFVNGALYYSMPNGSNYSYDNFIGGFDYWTSVTMAYDSLGNSYGTAAGGDINETKADQFRIMTSRWGYADRDAGGYNKATNNLRLELIGQYDYMKNEDTYEGFRNFDKERIRSPSLATGTASSNSTSVYLAYYDAINDEIRFKWGEFKTTKDKTWKNLTADGKTASFFGDYYGPSGSEAGDKVLDDGNDYSKYRLVHNSWIAGQTSRVYDTSGNTREAKVITTDGEPVYAGQYVSIAAIPGGGTDGDDAVVAVWWDGTNNQLLYSYNLKPKSILVGEYKQADTEWSTPVPIFDSNIGEYCKVAVIKEGSGETAHYSVHIVGYDGLNCDVWYAYLPNFNSTANKKTCLVDSYGLIGTELNIDVALDSSGNPVPYISYYAGSCAHPKIAYWAGTTSIANAEILNGVDDLERFTGVWEVSVIPTSSRTSVDHVNIGVWKDSTGTITWSTTDGNAPELDNSNIGETKLDYKEVFNSSAGNTGYKTGGHVWGNGTKNPILGYSITQGASGYIETAQMK